MVNTPGNDAEGGSETLKYVGGGLVSATIFALLCKYATVVPDPSEQELLEVLDRSPGVPPGFLLFIVPVLLYFYGNNRLDKTGRSRE